ncbi:PAS domain-containing protein [Desulfopila aestuarii]|uniref:PAS domain-containing protein n=1 Tax=Desulfopila aestuarii TaxID=231440 RepID=UPI0013564551|nr:PAS domain-containing protein [Desulfopila aestuarii]
MLLTAAGKVFWCDKPAADIFGRDVTGCVWAELLEKMMIASQEAEIGRCLPKNISDVLHPLTAKILLSGRSLHPMDVDISLAPIPEENGTVKQVVLTLTPATSMRGLAVSSPNTPVGRELGRSDAHRSILYEGILRITGTGVLSIDRGGFVIYLNREAGELLTISPDIELPRKLMNLLPEDVGQKWLEAIRFVFHYRCDNSFIESWGARHFQIDLGPVFGPDGSVESVVAAVRDVTGQWLSEIRYRELFRQTERGVLICESHDDGLTFTIKDLNSAAQKICDTTREKGVGQSVFEIMPGIENSGLPEAMGRVYKTTSEEHMPSFFEGVSGGRMWLDFSIFTLPNRELVVTFEDITVKYKTEQILRRSKEEWEKTFDALSDIVTIQDRHMRIIRANRAARTMFDLSFNDLIGNRCYEVFQGYSQPCEGCPVLNTCEDCSTHSGLIYNEKLSKTFDVHSSPIFDEQGQLKWLVQIARDVTQTLQQEAERRLLSAAIEQASESVVITDLDGMQQYVNPAFCETTGYTREEAIGQTAGILQSGVHDREFYSKMWNTLLAGKVWRGRLTNRKKNGILFKEDATISPVVDGSGKITNYIALKRDITREDSLEKQLQHAMKMEAIGTLAGGIAHDFNNILSAVIGYGYIAKGKLEKDNPVQEDLDQILLGGDRATDLVKQILTFARQETQDRFRPLLLQYIVKEVLKLMRSSLPATIRLNHFIDGSCGPIMADSSQVHQLLMNLLTNAKQSIGAEHGEITIRLTQHQKIVDGLVGMTGAYLHLSVEDTGCGMEPKQLERIFDPFFTTRAKEHGTGLGLSVVHGIVKKHNGEIDVTSTPGKGTVFDVYFNVAKSDPADIQEIHGPESRGSERIMLIDDEEVVGKVHERMLSKLGYRVTLFNSSLEAVKTFRDNPKCCDLVVTDMTMPNMTGAELAREMLSLRPDLPIIVVTGYSEAMDTEKAARIGIRHLLMKPVDRVDFSLRVKEALRGG